MSLMRPLLVSFAALITATGVVYPVLITGVAQTLFPVQAQGSLVRVNGQIRGSRLIAQATESPQYFWGRPSLTSPHPTNASASAGSTLAASNPGLAAAVARRVAILKSSDPGQTAPLPQDLVTASASGLDPHLSPAGARWQAPRVARARGIPLAEVLSLVEAQTRRFPLGSEGVNVLELNAALDRLSRGF